MHSFDRRGDLEEALERGEVPWGEAAAGEAAASEATASGAGGADNGEGVRRVPSVGGGEGGGADGGPWLGQLSGGEWQIRSRAATWAISHVVGQLRVLGLVSVVPPHASVPRSLDASTRVTRGL